MISALQWTSAAHWPENQRRLETLFSGLPEQRPQLVVLPELFGVFGAGEAGQAEVAEAYGSGPMQDTIAELARRHGVWVVAGTIPIQADERYAAASLLFDDQGVIQARYDKVHLFDAQVNDNTRSYQESRYTRPGSELVVTDTPFGRLGLAVCYDLRFPELFRALREQGAEIITLPSAFTKVTGAAHWETLVRARAIENQVYMVAPDQGGRHADGRETWGHSMIVDPWGTVVAEQEALQGIIAVSPDLPQLHKLRERMPVAQHNQFAVRFRHDAGSE